jgi:hypothetical protein
MFRTSIAVTLLAILICSNAHGQTTAQKKSSTFKNWWHNQSTNYAQRHRRVLRRAPQPTRQRRQPVQQVAGQMPNRMQYAPPASPRSVPAAVRVPGRATVQVAPQPVRSRPARRIRVAQQVPVRRATARLRPVPVQRVSVAQSGPVYSGGNIMPGSGMSSGTYPQTGASLYPSPQPNVPYQVGGTAITNQAFYPHEMLYPHKYKALYGPYYYRVNGRWNMTPFGMWSHENWKVEGTEVEVEYRSHISMFAGFKTPFTSNHSLDNAVGWKYSP